MSAPVVTDPRPQGSRSALDSPPESGNREATCPQRAGSGDEDDVAAANPPDAGPPRSGVASALGGLIAGGVIGKALGFLRELALAASFGTSPAVGAFRAGQTATLIPTQFFTGHALNSGFIPLCARYVDEDRPRADALFWSVFATMTAIALAIAGTLYLGADLWAGALIPGFGPDARATTGDMIRVMALGVPFLIQASLFSYLEMAHGSFVVGSVRPTVQNLGLFAGIGAAVTTGSPIFLAWGFVGFALLYHGFGGWRVIRSGFLSRPAGWAWREAREVLGEFLRLIRPLLLLPVVLQAAIAVERIVASLVSEDAVAALDYARTVSETGIVLIAVPMGFVGLAELGRLSERIAQRRIRAIVPLLLISMVPVSVFLGVHAEGIVRVLFERGQFGSESVMTTAAILGGLAFGFWANVAGYVLIKAMNARLRNRQSLHVAAFAAAAHIVVNLALYSWLGPLALGLGGSVFGLVSSVLAAKALGVLAPAARTLAPLLVGTVLYVPVGLSLRATGFAALLVSGTLWALFWMTFVAAVPRLRREVVQAFRNRPSMSGAE